MEFMSTTIDALETNVLLEEGKRVLQEEIDALHYTLSLLDKRFIDAVETLASSNKVIVSGIGKSGLIGQKIVATLVSTGTRAVFLHPVEALHGDIGIVEDGDSTIFLSKSGNTAELLKLMPFLKSRRVPVVGILGALGSPIANLATVVLDASVQREACPLRAAPMSSTTVALALGDALAAALMKRRNFTIGQFASFHPLGQLGRNISLCVAELMHKETRLPAVGPSASFREALIEMSAKNLGCVCVLDSNNRLMGIITDGDVRRILQQHEDITPLLVGDICTRAPITVTPDTLVGEALSLMENREQQISVLPVVDDSARCVGVVRVHDIVRVGI